MLDLKLDRKPIAPTDAATIILVRDAGAEQGLEVFCVERSKQSRFLGGAIVFPGGKLDPRDASEAWAMLVSPVRPIARALASPFAEGAEHHRALAVAACRETLEEAAMLHVTGGGNLAHEELLALRTALTGDPAALEAFLLARGLKLDLAALHPFARWITPEAESRRYDARFFLAEAPPGQRGAHDAHETMASLWATPEEILRRWTAGEVQVAPPTHRTLALLARCPTARAALDLADASILEPICPRLVRQDDTMALVLPGDPEHEVPEARVAGSSRYVLRGERWLDEDAPR